MFELSWVFSDMSVVLIKIVDMWHRIWWNGKQTDRDGCLTETGQPEYRPPKTSDADNMFAACWSKLPHCVIWRRLSVGKTCCWRPLHEKAIAVRERERERVMPVCLVADGSTNILDPSIVDQAGRRSHLTSFLRGWSCLAAASSSTDFYWPSGHLSVGGSATIAHVGCAVIR